MRRFVPIVIPIMVLVVSVLVVAMLHQVTRWRVWLTVGVCAVLVALVGRPSAAIVGRPLWSGAIERSSQVASLFPQDSVILVSPELSGTHLQTSLAYLHDRSTLLLRSRYDDPLMLERVIREWLAAGTRVFLMLGERDYPVSAPRLSASLRHETALELQMLETSLSSLPQAVITRTQHVRLFEIAASEVPRESYDVGALTDDVLFDARGFYSAEVDPDLSSGTYRWAGAVASITIPSEDVIQVELDGGRPEGVAPAEISIWIGGQAVAQDLVLPDSPITLTLANPAAEVGGVTDSSIRSTVFNPRNLGLSADGRSLGARIYQVRFINPD